MSQESFATEAEFYKVDEELGLVLGFGIVCTVDGEPYFDVQGDHIPDAAMIKAAADFMVNSRATTEMHVESDGGTVVFAFPLTDDIAKAFDIQTSRTGLLIGMRPSPEVFEKFRKGEFTGFSIGGKRIDEEVVEE